MLLIYNWCLESHISSQPNHLQAEFTFTPYREKWYNSKRCINLITSKRIPAAYVENITKREVLISNQSITIKGS